MFLNLWNYLRGYVIIEVSGFSVERFLNLAVHKGIYLWDINKNDKGIIAKVSIKGFKMLKPFAKKTHCRIKITKKQGMPFEVHRYRKRKILALGILFFIIVLNFLSSFIWTVEIIGNERIDKEELKAYCLEAGLKPGAYKRKLDLRVLEKNFMSKFKDISWISISTKGTKAKIELTETIEKPQIIDRNTPCDIIAAKNGLIISVVVNSGTPKVKQKDVVEKGDILVSGELIIGEEGAEQSREYVHASAEIKAKLWYQFELEENIKFNQKNYTGQTKKGYSAEILNKKFNILNTRIPYSNYDTITDIKRLDFGGDFDLPLALVINEYKEYTLQQNTRTVDEAKILIEQKLDKLLEENFNQDVEILDKNIQYQNENDKLKAKITITTIERIDEQKEIGGNITSGTDGENNTNTE